MDDTYKQDGVDTVAGDSLSTYAGNLIRNTWENCPMLRVNAPKEGHFRGPRDFEIVRRNSYRTRFLPMSDGIGTKPGLHIAADSPEYAGYDLVAMLTTDAWRYGHMPVALVGNTLDVRTTGADGSPERRFVERLYEGLVSAAKQAGIAVLGGETAEVGRYVGWDNPDSTIAFMWSGAAVALTKPHHTIDGSEMAEGDIVVALGENGFRSNGISSVRAAFAMQFGERWWESSEARALLLEATTPSVLYDRALRRALGWERDVPDTPTLNITAITHISGGGVRDKFGADLLRQCGFDARLDNLFTPPSIMQTCAAWRGAPAQDLYGTWNGGQGMLVVLKTNGDAERLIEISRDCGVAAQVCGAIGQKSGAPRLTIASKYEGGGEVVYTY